VPDVTISRFRRALGGASQQSMTSRLEQATIREFKTLKKVAAGVINTDKACDS